MGVVREAGVGLAFVGGLINSEDLCLSIAELRKSGDVGLSHWTGEEPRYPLPPNPDAEGTNIALEFTARSDDATSLEALLQGMPPECTLRRIDSQLIERCLWRDDLIRVSGSLERFLEKSVGYCLMRGDEILSEAYATYYALNTCEMATVTIDAHRGNGYSTLACAATIRECEKSGFQTVWICESTNRASAAVARKLGYSRERGISGALYRGAKK